MQIGGKRVYLDYAAAAPIRREVMEVMELYSHEHFANPSAIYREAEEAKKALEEARSTIAKIVGAKAGEVVFVSGSTEANNLAILGFARSQKSPGHIVTTPIEHPSILEPVRVLESERWKVSRLSVSQEGFVNLEELKNTEPTLVTLAWANSDIGVIQPIQEIKKAIGGATFHIDASQAGGLLDLKSASRVADLLTVSSSKIGGPRGVAALIVRLETKLEPLIYGGGQERQLRSGTENVLYSIGFAKALELAEKERARESERLTILRDKLIKEILDSIKDAVLTGPKKERLANHASFAFENIDGEELVIRLDERGFAVGTGSACLSAGQAGATNDYEVAPAVKALNLSPEFERGTLRVTLGRETREEDIDNFVRALENLSQRR